MSYTLEFTKQAKKQLEQLDTKQKAILKAWLKENLEACENPRIVKDSKKIESVEDGWRWRIGSYRVLGVIRDNTITIVVFKIGHRRDIYRGM